MPSNKYYDHANWPTFYAFGSSKNLRTELDNITSGFDSVETDINLKAPTDSPTFTGTVTIPAGASIDGFAPINSPVFTGTPAGPTATVGTATTQLATTAFVAATILAVSLPGQGSATAGDVITTDGAGTASWQAPDISKDLSPTLGGQLDCDGHTIINAPLAAASTDLTSLALVQATALYF